MRTSACLLVLLLAALFAVPAQAQLAAPTAGAPPAAAPPAKPKLQIIPGKVIVPTDNMRRIWGELVSLDMTTRTGTFRNESNDQVMPFIVMPYAELLHHATRGDLQDYRLGERAIFRMHPNEKGDWVWLTYIQDEMNFLNNHKEYYWVDRIDALAGKLECTDANFDKSEVREKGIMLETDAGTRYWRQGEPASFADIKVGDKLRTRTHGIGKGKVRRCWEVFFDDASLLKFQAEQKEVHRQRMIAEGLPAYIDQAEADLVRLTIFPEATELITGQKPVLPVLKPGAQVRVAPAGEDRKPSAEPATATIAEISPPGRLLVVTLKLEKPTGGDFKPEKIARVWIGP